MNKSNCIFIFISFFILFPYNSYANVGANLNNIYISLNKYISRINSIYVNYTQTSNFSDYYYTSMNENPKIHPMKQIFYSIFAVKSNKLFSRYTISNQPYDIEKDWIINHKMFMQIQEPFTKHEKHIETDLVNNSSNDYTHNFPPLLLSMKPDMSKWLINTLQSEKTTLSKIIFYPPIGRVYIVDVNYRTQAHRFTKKYAQYWLAEKYNYMIVKSRIETQFSTNDKNIETDDYTNWNKHGDFWFPNDSSQKIWIQDNKSKHYLINLLCHLNEIKINNIPSNIFNVDLPPNSILNDQINHIIYRIGPNGKWIPTEMNTPPPQPSFLQRIPHWLFILTLFVMLLIGTDTLQRWLRKRTYSSS